MINNLLSIIVPSLLADLQTHVLSKEKSITKINMPI